MWPLDAAIAHRFRYRLAKHDEQRRPIARIRCRGIIGPLQTFIR
jgi:hypothetical protein